MVSASSIGIYQPFYKAELVSRLDKGFIPFDWMSNPAPALRELALHHEFAKNRIYLKHSLTGLLSPKFFSKTSLTSQHVKSWITDNPGRDLYIISGAPFVPYQNYNGIERNAARRPGFIKSLRELCQPLDLELPDEWPRQNNTNFSGCNFWIGSQAFWAAWNKAVVKPIMEMIEGKRLPDHLLSQSPYPAPTPVCLLTFMYERLIDFYVSSARVNCLYYPWTAQSLLALHYHPDIKDYLTDMVPAVDRIDQRGEWRTEERIWLHNRYDAVKRKMAVDTSFTGFTSTKGLSSDPRDFDLPRRYPPSSES